MNRKLVRKIALIVVVIFTILSPVLLKPMFYGFGGTKEVITASGVIDSKRSIDYECGSSKNRQTCTDYMLLINGREHSVGSNTFHKNTEQQHITLVREVDNREVYWWEVVLIVISIISLSLTGTFVLVRAGFFLFWCFISDSRKTFKDWMNE